MAMEHSDQAQVEVGQVVVEDSMVAAGFIMVQVVGDQAILEVLLRLENIKQ